MREQSCGSCRFWLSRPVEGNSSEGLCRRCPPTAHTWVSATRSSAETLTMAQFPPMEADSWCGEWQAVDDERILLSPGRTAAAISPPPMTTDAIDAPAWDDNPPEWENDVVEFVDATEDEPDPFDAILRTDDTELWEGAAALGDTETADSAGPVNGNTAFDDTTVVADESVILTPQSLVAEASGEIDDSGEPSPAGAVDSAMVDPLAGAEDQAQAPSPAGYSVDAYADAPKDADAEPAPSRFGSDFTLPVDDATASDAVAENAPLECSSDADHNHPVSEFPDPAEWPNDYSGANAGSGDADGIRPPAKASSPENGGDEWPDWSEWLQTHSGAELRLDTVVDTADKDSETGEPVAAVGDKSNHEPAGNSTIDDPIPGSGSPIPEPPPWLNEPPKPGFLGWARRTWR